MRACAPASVAAALAAVITYIDVAVPAAEKTSTAAIAGAAAAVGGTPSHPAIDSATSTEPLTPQKAGDPLPCDPHPRPKEPMPTSTMSTRDRLPVASMSLMPVRPVPAD